MSKVYEELEELNENEMKVLIAMFNSSAGNGHDFGITEDLTGGNPNNKHNPFKFVDEKYKIMLKGLYAKQIVGYVSSLSKKGFVYCSPEDIVNGLYPVNQFTIEKKGFKALGYCDKCRKPINDCVCEKII